MQGHAGYHHMAWYTDDKGKYKEECWSEFSYICSCCGAKGVKLWRLSSTCMEHQTLFCGSCALKDQIDGTLELNGQLNGITSKIGNLVPALQDDMRVFGGYPSIPDSDSLLSIWEKLPLKEKK